MSQTLYVASLGGRPLAIGVFANRLAEFVASANNIDPSDVTVEAVPIVSNIPAMKVQAGTLRVAGVRATDPKTSRAAREAAIDFSKGQHRRILRFLADEHGLHLHMGMEFHGRTASEIDHTLGMTPSSVSKRLGELERAGLVEVNGTRESLRSPRQQQIYFPTTAGLALGRQEAEA